jgi:hypothetical protein
VAPVNYSAANLDDDEVVSDCNIKKEQVLRVDEDSMSISYFLFDLSLIIHQLLPCNRRMKRPLDVRTGAAELIAASFKMEAPQ